ncbi:hypothetical protein OU798_06455 [Prolixibacteraceae bacterium Z1-6]|uniref:Uncharacterized protein n=1 Tax=Draconibacterium aestuarii TaxID=2998507 RepID=A0A9X3F557_9BACT|nr:hypothetical protein [Prolixibacteraceae bacterium Z1-6]
MHYYQGGSLQEENFDFYTTYDLDAEKAAVADKISNSPKFNFDTTNIYYTALESVINNEYPIISTHWAEIADFNLLNEQKHEKKEPPVIINKTKVDYDIDYKPLLWFN